MTPDEGVIDKPKSNYNSTQADMWRGLEENRSLDDLELKLLEKRRTRDLSSPSSETYIALMSLSSIEVYPLPFSTRYSSPCLLSSKKRYLMSIWAKQYVSAVSSPEFQKLLTNR